MEGINRGWWSKTPILRHVEPTKPENMSESHSFRRSRTGRRKSPVTAGCRNFSFEHHVEGWCHYP
jgi:hypothetical protein